MWLVSFMGVWSCDLFFSWVLVMWPIFLYVCLSCDLLNFVSCVPPPPFLPPSLPPPSFLSLSLSLSLSFSLSPNRMRPCWHYVLVMNSTCCPWHTKLPVSLAMSWAGHYKGVGRRGMSTSFFTPSLPSESDACCTSATTDNGRASSPYVTVIWKIFSIEIFCMLK